MNYKPVLSRDSANRRQYKKRGEMLYANIVHVVKNCYKIKIDSRDWQSVFHRFLQCSTPHFFSFKASLNSKGTTLGEQRSPNCNATEA